MGGGSSIVSPAEFSVNVKGAVAVSIPISMLGFYGVHNLLKRIEKTSKQRNEAEKNSNFLNEPWRKIHETLTDVPQLKETFMNNISVRSTETDTPLNILLLGQAGSGKSSFVNACFTALLQEGRVVKRAVDGSVGSESITEGLTYYKLEIKTGNKTEYVPVQLIDCRGLSKGDKGVQTGDIEKICRGHIKDGYLINPKEGIKPDDKMYRQHPQEKDKIHCVVYVLAADEVGFVQEEVLDQFNTIKRMFRKGMCNCFFKYKFSISFASDEI
ncbi:interferon-induced protein 44-like isoform X2 [Saccostrea cucullata]|uniref:interferon-induced protein 44-like isoform X2 n=1 Tax=Saccostrea cuccullata TaxID=36930 RepID=UPI002ED18A93